jgi:hypothetical protein
VPYEECPWGGRDICFLALGVNVGRHKNGRYVGAEEKEVHKHVHHLQYIHIVNRNYRKKEDIITLRTSS